MFLRSKSVSDLLLCEQMSVQYAMYFMIAVDYLQKSLYTMVSIN